MRVFPHPSMSDLLTGAYDLVSIGGRSLPTLVDGDPRLVAPCVAKGEIAFGLEGPHSATYARTVWREGRRERAFVTVSMGTYRVDAGTVDVVIPGTPPESLRGRVDPDRRRLTLRSVGPDGTIAPAEHELAFLKRTAES